MPRWGKVTKGQRVELKGEAYTVDAIKIKKSKAVVTLTGRRGTFPDREVPLDGKVTVLEAAPSGRRSTSDKPVKGGPLHDENGTQRRWAKQGELDKVLPPTEADGGAWAKPKGKAEKALGSILGATLVGEATDPDVGWYVPPLDPSTVHAHLLLFHDIEPEGDYKALIAMHDRLHADALKGPYVGLHVNHWHTKERPAS